MRVFCESEDSGKDYDITVVDGKLACNCPDFRYRRQPAGQYCKHLVEFIGEFQGLLPMAKTTYTRQLAETVSLLNQEAYTANTRDRTNINAVVRYLGNELAQEIIDQG